MKVYLIPGLGFDDRIFANLELKGIDYEYLNWIEPLKNESFRNYTIRFSERIKECSTKIILIGHSLGGIIAQEIAEILTIEKIILISCIKSRDELPLHFRIVKPLLIHKIFSRALTAKTIKYWGKQHDYETAEEQLLMTDMVNRHSNHYLQWALKQLSIWQNPTSNRETKVFQIHGEQDKTFPIKLVHQPNETIKNAGHFMVFKQAKLINQLIERELKL